MEEKAIEELFAAELEKARAMVEDWVAAGSEDRLVEKILEQEELEKEQVQESVRVAVELAVKALAELKVYQAQLESLQQKNQETE